MDIVLPISVSLFQEEVLCSKIKERQRMLNCAKLKECNQRFTLGAFKKLWPRVGGRPM